jgi:DNA polymerase I-like protein with 3'-5' exonuclease and polymerase domains
LDFNSIRRDLIWTSAEFISFVEDILEYPSLFEDLIGFDTETSVGIYPNIKVAGFSVYSRALCRAVYVPIGHDAEINVSWDSIRPFLQKLFTERVMVAHAWQYDGPLMIRLGIVLNEIRDSYVLANTLQARNVGLKDLVLEYEMVPFKETVSYINLVGEIRGFSEEQVKQLSKDESPELGFQKIDVSKYPKAVQYACDDAIWTRELWDVLVSEHDNLVGDHEAAELLRIANDDTAALLAESASEGYLIDRSLLEQYIKDKEVEIADEERGLSEEVRQLMGWNNVSTAENI